MRSNTKVEFFESFKPKAAPNFDQNYPKGMRKPNMIKINKKKPYCILTNRSFNVLNFSKQL